MSKGKRYENQRKINLKKVFAVMMAFFVIIIAIIMVKNVLSKAKNTKTIETINYFALYEDEKWGILGSNGQIVIEPMYQEMPIVIDKEKDIFLCTYDINENEKTYKTKAINSKNEEILTEFDKVEALENYDEAGNVWYEENIIKVQKNGLWGLINLEGKELISPMYNSIETLKGVKNSLIVEKENLYGLVNNKGNKIIDAEYSQIKKFGDNYINGYIVANKEGKYGIINVSGEKILDTIYENIENIYSDRYFVIKNGEKEEVVNKKGEKLIENGYDSIVQIANSGIIITKDSKYGLMDFEGNIKIDTIYDELKELNTDIFLAKKDGKYGVIDIEKNEKIAYSYKNVLYDKKANIYIAESEDYTSTLLNSNFEVKLVGVLSELNTDKGFMKLKIGEEYKYYNFKFEEKSVKEIYPNNKIYLTKKDGKYGYVNTKEETIVDFIYDDGTELNKYGYAAIKKDGLWGAIDSEGKIIIEPNYKLDENLVIDFIGKWHLGLDLNMNYYCSK